MIPPTRLPRSQRKAKQRAIMARMVQNEPDPTRWPEHLRQILIAVADALEGKQITPELITSRAERYRLAVPDHEIAVVYRPAREEGNSGGSSYEVCVTGPRFIGSWRYFPGQLDNALKRCRTVS